MYECILTYFTLYTGFPDLRKLTNATATVFIGSLLQSHFLFLCIGVQSSLQL
jgi:hypothetical protein